MGQKLKKILYLEDDMSIAEIGQMALVDVAGFNVRHCARGGDAIDQYDRFEPDLLLFDYMLPDMDGIETYRIIRQDHDNKIAPVVFMTGKSQKHEREMYMSEGALSVIVKPFDTFTLGERLTDLWDERQDNTSCYSHS